MPAPRDAPETWERHAGAACAPLSGYRRREPEKTLLHQVVRERLETFLAAARDRSAHGRGLPAFVERDLRAYLTLVPDGVFVLDGDGPPASSRLRRRATRTWPPS